MSEGRQVTPFERFVRALGSRVVRQTPRGVLARCPAHDDHDPSLSVDQGDDGCVLLQCRSRKCSVEAICSALGIEVRELFAAGSLVPATTTNGRSKKTHESWATPDAAVAALHKRMGGTLSTFDYHAADGAHVGSVLRFDRANGKKTFRPLSRLGTVWVAEGMPTPRPLYRLLALREVTAEEVIVVVEGEKKCEAVVALGIPATTSAHGAQSAAGTDWSPLRGRRVAVLPDRDDAGGRYASSVVQLAGGAGAASIAIVELDGLGDGEDVYDWITKRRERGLADEVIAAELRELAAAARPVEAEPAPQTTPAGVIEPRQQPSAPWPAPLGDVVRVGVLRRFLDLVETQTEADPAAIVIDFLVRVGNAAGRGPHFTVSGDRHGCNLFACVVGQTAQGRKGTSVAYPRRLLELADADWSAHCVKSGLSSGEGVIHAVRDPSPTGRNDRDGNPMVDAGVTDKRLLVHESELARTLRAASRRDNTLMPILRQAWEGGRLATMTKQPYSATDAHTSLVAHVTRAELVSLLADDDVHGGTINRFLFIASKRCRELPFGGEVPEVELARVGAELQRCLVAARGRGRMEFSALLRELWPTTYSRLLADEQAPGILGALLGRAVAQVRRLAVIFALVDSCAEVDMPHLDAALELWRYSRQTVAYVFGTSTGNRIADRILGELRGTPGGLARTAMHKLFDRHVTAADIDAALAMLHSMKLAEGRRTNTGGRPVETWYAVDRGDP